MDTVVSWTEVAFPFPSVSTSKPAREEGHGSPAFSISTSFRRRVTPAGPSSFAATVRRVPLLRVCA